ncbi:MAG: glutamate synthase subunit beta [Nitrospinae bacterium]|nr:glutamate synthase subunit beta [Nitrospinota bacterium]
MGKINGFKEFNRKTQQYQPVEQRIKNYSEFVIQLAEGELQNQGARCLECGTPFCQPNCPLNNVPPDFNDLVFRGKWREALKVLLSTNNFPEFTGRLCPALCEAGCVLGLIDKPVTIKNIELSIIERGFREGWIKPEPPAHRTGKKVAVVGSGPSGLAVAAQLNKAGHEVTVFERADRIGGLLRYGIPDFKLDKGVIDRRVAVMAGEGVKFVTSADVGNTVSAKKIKSEFDAVVLAAGATIPRDLPIPGRDAKGVHFAVEFLRQNNMRVAGDVIPKREEILATGKHVLVIGGGDTGSDCVGTSIRQGAASVTQIELLDKPPAWRTEETKWPTFPGPKMLSTSTSQEEGCTREWSVLSKEFLKDDKGNLTGVRRVQLKWINNAKFEEVPGSEAVYKADLAFLAMGFLHTNPKGVVGELGLQIDARGNVQTDGGYQTNVPGVFAAGDARRGQSLIVWAISEGRECARAVDVYLSGSTRLESKNQTLSDSLR